MCSSGCPTYSGGPLRPHPRPEPGPRGYPGSRRARRRIQTDESDNNGEIKLETATIGLQSDLKGPNDLKNVFETNQKLLKRILIILENLSTRKNTDESKFKRENATIGIPGILMHVLDGQEMPTSDLNILNDLKNDIVDLKANQKRTKPISAVSSRR